MPCFGGLYLILGRIACQAWQSSLDGVRQRSRITSMASGKAPPQTLYNACWIRGGTRTTTWTQSKLDVLLLW
eukprot:symbB.v1.2.002600.t1/scaffold135.1/size305288/20